MLERRIPNHLVGIGYRSQVMAAASVAISERAARRIGEILKTEDDLVISREGAVVLVDSASVPFLAGSEVDFVDDLIGASFRVVNPNATASCGCGTSFSI